MNRHRGTRMRRVTLALGVALVALWAGTATALTTVHSRWTGGTTGNWSNAASWNPAVVPHDIGSNAYWVRVDSSATATAVTVDGTYLIDRLQIDAGDRVDIADAQDLEVTAANGAGVIQNAGTLLLSAEANFAYLQLLGGPVTLQGGGTIQLSNSAGNYIYRSDLLGALVNVDNTIRGAGNIGYAGTLMPITNGGTIIADQPTPLILTSTSAGTINTGTLRAALGGTLRLGGGAIANAGGTIEALHGSVVELGASAAVTGGTLRTVGTGVVRVTASSGVSVTGVANQGQLQVANAMNLSLATGTMQNTGRIEVASSVNETSIQVSGGPVTLAGGGEVLLSNSAANWIYASDALGTLINQDNRIHGAGNIGWAGSLMPITNAGTITADQSTPLVVTSTSAGVVNTGTLRADLGATLQLAGGAFTNTGGTIEALHGSLVELGTYAAVTGGILRTVGTGLFRVTGAAGTTLASLSNQGRVEVPNGKYLTLSTGTIQNSGRIDLAGGEYETSINPAGGPVTLTGGGEIALSNSVNNWIYPADALGSLTNQDNTIHGAGNIGWVGAPMSIANGGTIMADQSVPLTIEPGTATFTNTGTVRASAGAVLLCNKTPVNFSGGTLTGGTWEAVEGTLRVVGVDVITNAAHIRLNGASAAFYNAAAGTTSSLAGFGTNAVGSSFRLENGASYTAPATFQNSGEVQVEPGCAFTSTATYTQNAGRTVINGTLNAPSPVPVQGGALAGRGAILGNVVNTSVVAPGNSVGTLTINGNYTQLPGSGRLVIALGGTAPGEFGVLQVSGQVALDGDLELMAIHGYQVQPGDTFRILNGSSCSGVFSSVHGECLAPDVCLHVVYDPTGVTLEAYGIDVATPEVEGLPQELRLATSWSSGGGQELRLEMPKQARVALAIYDLTGRQVARLTDGLESAGVHTYRWNGRAADGSRVGSGVYFARAQISEEHRAVARTTRLVIVH